MVFKVVQIFIGSVFALSVSYSAVAQDKSQPRTQEIHNQEGQARSFTKKHYAINGQAVIVKTGDHTEVIFSEDFETRSGPDLKVYLSKKTIEELEDATVDPNSLKIGVLKSKSGRQTYIIPDGISLHDYKSVIIHCEAFTKLWGGFNL